MGGQKISKCLCNFGQLSTLTMNISEKKRGVKNRNNMWSSTAPPMSNEKKFVDILSTNKKKFCCLISTYPKLTLLIWIWATWLQERQFESPKFSSNQTYGAGRVHAVLCPKFLVIHTVQHATVSIWRSAYIYSSSWFYLTSNIAVLKLIWFNTISTTHEFQKNDSRNTQLINVKSHRAHC